MGRAVSAGALVLAACAVAWLIGAPAWVLVIGAALLATSVPLGADRYRSLGHARSDGYLVTRSGSFVRRRAALSEHAVIGATLRATVFQRRAGLVTMTATTAAGKQGYSVIDVSAADGVALADAVLPELLAQFRRPPG
jgi:putative membrane protein